ncbi:MAG: hypothetical protein ABUK01_00410 [Leptospirales bacterium]
MIPILEQIPDPEEVQFQLSEMARTVDEIVARAEEIASGDFSLLFEGASSLPFPKPENLTGPMLESLNAIVKNIPDKKTLLVEQYKYREQIRSQVETLLAFDPAEAQSLFELITPKFASLDKWIEKADFFKSSYDPNGSPDFLKNHIRNLHVISSDSGLHNKFKAANAIAPDLMANVREPVSFLRRSVWFDPLRLSLETMRDADFNDAALLPSHRQKLEQIKTLLSETALGLETRFNEIKSAVSALPALNELEALDDATPENDLDSFLEVLPELHELRDGLFCLCLGANLKSAPVNFYLLYENFIFKNQELPKEISRAGTETLKFLKKVPIAKSAALADSAISTWKEAAAILTDETNDLKKDILGATTQLTSLASEFSLSEIGSAMDEAVKALRQSVSEIEPRVDEVAKQIENMIEEISPEISALDLSNIQSLIRELLETCEGIFSDPELGKVIDVAGEANKQVEKVLNQVPLAALFEQLHTALDDVGKKLNGVDTKSLSASVRLLVDVALTSIHSVDLPKQLGKVIKEQFSAIFMEAAKALYPFREMYKLISDTVDNCGPERLLEGDLLSSFQSLQKIIESIDPQNALAPLKKVQVKLNKELELLDPAKLLVNIKEQLSKITTRLSELSPDLISEELQKITFGDSLEDEPNVIFSERVGSFDDLIATLESALAGFPEESLFDDAISNLENIPETLEDLKNRMLNFLSGEQVTTSDFKFLKDQALELGAATITPEISFCNETTALLNECDLPAASAALGDLLAEILTKIESATLPALDTGEVDTSGAAELAALGQDVAAIDPTQIFQKANAASIDNPEWEQRRKRYKQRYDTCVKIWEATRAKIANLSTDTLGGSLDNLTGQMQMLWPPFSSKENVAYKAYLKSTREICKTFQHTHQELQSYLFGLKEFRRLSQDALTLYNPTEFDFTQEAEAWNALLEQVQSNVNSKEVEKRILNLRKEIDKEILKIYPAEKLENLDTIFDLKINNPLQKSDPQASLIKPLLPLYEKLCQAKEKINIDVMLKPTMDKLALMESDIQSGIKRTLELVLKIPQVEKEGDVA